MTVKMLDVQYIRKMTGAGVMDCKNALSESGGDYDKAVEIIRKKGQVIAAKRESREASEGCVLAASIGKFASIVAVKCETDFVAKGKDFIDMVKRILNVALENRPKTIEDLNDLFINGFRVHKLVTDRSGISGEKMKLGIYEYLNASYTVAYVHPGNKLATIVGFNQAIVDPQVAKDIAMQVTAMNPVCIDKNSISAEIIEREQRIAREKAIEQGKSEAILDHIVKGALNKYYKECVLLLQDFVKDPRITISDYLKRQSKDLAITGFRRVNLNME